MSNNLYLGGLCIGDVLRGWGRSSWMGTFFVGGDVHFPRSYIRFGSRKPIAEGTMTVESERPHPRRTSPSTKSVPIHGKRPLPRGTSPLCHAVYGLIFPKHLCMILFFNLDVSQKLANRRICERKHITVVFS